MLRGGEKGTGRRIAAFLILGEGPAAWGCSGAGNAAMRRASLTPKWRLTG